MLEAVNSSLQCFLVFLVSTRGCSRGTKDQSSVEKSGPGCGLLLSSAPPASRVCSFSPVTKMCFLDGVGFVFNDPFVLL